jgi:hypothetical protein
VDEKYVDGSYRWTNVTVVNCHSRRFVGWMLSLGRNVAWSVCGWTDRQGTAGSPFWQWPGYCNQLIKSLRTCIVAARALVNSGWMGLVRNSSQQWGPG